MRARELLAWNVRRLRIDRGVSQEKLAADAGIDRTYVSDVEREVRNASVEILDRLATTLGVPVAELFRIPEEGEERPTTLPGGRRSPN